MGNFGQLRPLPDMGGTYEVGYCWRSTTNFDGAMGLGGGRSCTPDLSDQQKWVEELRSSDCSHARRIVEHRSPAGNVSHLFSCPEYRPYHINRQRVPGSNRTNIPHIASTSYEMPFRFVPEGGGFGFPNPVRPGQA